MEPLDWEVNGDGPVAQELGDVATDLPSRRNHEAHETHETNHWPTPIKTAACLPGQMDRLGPTSSPETYAVIGALIDVHKHLGPGYLESTYGDALEVEFADRQIPALREVPLHVSYKGRDLRTRYRADFLAYGRLLVELKAQAALTPVDEAQVIHYLRGLGLPVALLVNFGGKSCEVRRFVGEAAQGPQYRVDFV